MALAAPGRRRRRRGLDSATCPGWVIAIYFSPLAGFIPARAPRRALTRPIADRG